MKIPVRTRFGAPSGPGVTLRNLTLLSKLFRIATLTTHGDMNGLEFDPTNLFNISGHALRFHIHLLQDHDLRSALSAQIESFGGCPVSPDGDENPDKPILVLYDAAEVDLVQLSQSALKSPHICLQWEWVLACNKEKRFIGPMENDWGGHRFYPVPGTPSSATSSTRYTHSTSPTAPPSHKVEPALTSDSTRLASTIQPTSSNNLGRAVLPNPAKAKESTNAKRRRPSNPEVISNDLNESSATAKRPKISLKKARPEAIQGTASASTSGSASPSLQPPARPTHVQKNGWFGHDFTNEDREFMAKYLDYWCTKYDDPDFKALFKDMNITAPHHKATTWGIYFYKNESDFATKIPSLRRLYTSSDEEEDGGSSSKLVRAKETSGSIKRSLSSQNRAPWVPKEKFKSADALTVAPSEEKRKALIRFLAEAPEGVEQSELLQNFAHFNPGYSWRTWQKLVRENQASLDRAIAKRRAKIAQTPPIS
ncbi:hypothetical protein FRB95_002942 [Tulasnella sp. JGI-2019a]|nr:hypothetical protein FRB95_002942 [Tulasnella sp. JGI-2019a]